MHLLSMTQSTLSTLHPSMNLAESHITNNNNNAYYVSLSASGKPEPGSEGAIHMSLSLTSILSVYFCYTLWIQIKCLIRF